MKIKGLLGLAFMLLLVSAISGPAYADTVTYSYDNLNRLTSVQYDNGTVIEYTYDAAGNRLTLNASVPAVQITVDTSPSGLLVDVDGIAYTAPQTFTWEINSNHTLGIPSPQDGGPGSRYIFNAWSDGGTQSHTIQTPLSDTAYTAYLNTQYVLTTTSTPGEGGIIAPTPQGLPESCIDNCYWYDAGTPVALSAQPNGDYTFTGWGGDCTGTGACVVTMNGPISVTATFDDLVQYLLSVNKTGTGDGSVSSNPPGINCGTNCSSNYPANTEVTLSADPSPGAVFTGWSGDPDCSDGIVTMDAVKSCTAAFEQTYALTVNKSGVGSGTVFSTPPGIDCGAYCSTSFINGAVVSLTAIPSGNSLFAGWSGGCSGTDISTPVTMDAGKTCTARFIVGLVGEYYNNSDLTGLGLVRTDPVIAFDWGTGSPALAIDADTFAVRWTGKLQVDYNETYTFNAVTDDGVRIWLDGHLVLDYWQTGGVSLNNTMNLMAGLHDIKVEFFENTGTALAQLYWSSPSTPYAIIPNDHLYPPDGAGSSPVLEWAGGAGFAVDGVEPESGDPATMFTYRMKYTDLDGNHPKAGFPRAHILKGGSEITGSPFTMSYESGGYTGGAIYSVSKTLAAGADYTYYFDAVDNTGRQAVAVPVIPTPTAPVDAPDVAGVLSNTLTVAKAGTGGGTITSDLAGINCGTDCQEIYNYETIVTLTATPDSSSTFVGWSGDTDCTDGVVTMTADKACTAAFNTIVLNGGFETDTSKWVFYTNGAGTFANDAAGDGSAHAAHIKITTAGTNVQMNQSGLVLDANTKYRLSFKAYSNTGHDVSVSLQKNVSPYTGYGLSGRVFNLTSAWQTFTVEFTTTGFTGTVNNGRLMFWMAPYDAVGDHYYFDDVVLEKVTVSSVPPAITTQPANQTVSEGQTAAFTVAATGTAPLSYQWQRNGADIPGATSATYTTPATVPGDSGATFKCIVTNAYGDATSDAATLTVTSGPIVSVVVNGGFETGTSPWVFYTNGAGTLANDATGDGSIRAGHIKITMPGTNVQMNQAGLALEANTLYRLSFKAYSNTGHDVSVSLQKNVSPYTGYGLSGRVFNLTTAWQNFTVEFTTTGFAGTVNDGRLMFWLAPYDAVGDHYYFDDVVLEKVTASAVPPAITTQPANQTVSEGQTAAFTVAATGTAPLSYQWQKDGVDISGATSATYTTPATATAPGDSGATFRCIVTNAYGSATSNAATLTVVTIDPISIVTNGGFETGTSPWVFYTNGAGTLANDAAGDGSARAAHIKITTPGTNVQMNQAALALEANTQYRLSFKAYSNTGHDVSVSLQKNVSPYTGYGLSGRVFNLTTAWQNFTVEFTTTGFAGTVNDGRLMFWLAPYDASGDHYYFDDVVLEKIGTP